MRVERTCAACGAVFNVKASQLSHGRGRVCSLRCASVIGNRSRPAADPERRRASQRQAIAERRAAFFTGKTCDRCGGTENLELHHLDQADKVSHHVWTWRAERREAELAKCVARCRDCHNKAHAQEMREQRGNGTLHGSRGGYIARKCRCPLCVEWARRAWTRNNAKRAAAKRAAAA